MARYEIDVHYPNVNGNQTARELGVTEKEFIANLISQIMSVLGEYGFQENKSIREVSKGDIIIKVGLYGAKDSTCTDSIIVELHTEPRRPGVLPPDVEVTRRLVIMASDQFVKYKSDDEVLEDIRKALDKFVNKGDKFTIEKSSSGGCYIATAVYGSYDCPEVWTFRRYRDEHLASSVVGRMFIKTYYAISPMVVKRFGESEWFNRFWRGKLDRIADNLKRKGYDDTPYADR